MRVRMLTCASFISVADESNVGSLVGNTAGETTDDLRVQIIKAMNMTKQKDVQKHTHTNTHSVHFALTMKQN